MIVGTGLPAARRLLDRPLAGPATGGSTMLLDVGVDERPGDLFAVSDLDDAGWLEAFSRADPTLAPAGTLLVQAHRPVRAGEDRAAASAALHRLMDAGVPGWTERTRWRRQSVAHLRTGALDLPGHTWHDRPAVDQGDGVFLAGDDVAAPGLLSEVSCVSAVTAAQGAVRLLTAATGHRR